MTKKNLLSKDGVQTEVKRKPLKTKAPILLNLTLTPKKKLPLILVAEIVWLPQAFVFFSFVAQGSLSLHISKGPNAPIIKEKVGQELSYMEIGSTNTGAHQIMT